ncbi:hypothetical protein B0H13DRAFT_2659512 [Mycena leptocephala]|nr:hypothetical protein B0H13DRAFT_2659512 [Mycena leptocephala]
MRLLALYDNPGGAMMHRCLQIDDIVAEIFLHLECRSDTYITPPERKVNMRALAALAITCRGFAERALDILLQDQPLDHLLHCLPQDLLVIETNEKKDDVENSDLADEEDEEFYPNQKMRLLRSIVDEDWNRCRIYATRIIALDFDPYSMSWEIIPTPHFLSFLRPTITTLTLHSPGVSASSLPTLGQTCPRLQGLRVYLDSDQLLDLSSCVRGLQFLERMEAHSLDWEALEYLGHLPSLVSLRLSALPETFPSLPDIPMFSSLEELSLGATTCPATYIFKLFVGSAITQLNLELRGDAALSPLLTLGQTCPRLNDLRIYHEKPTDIIRPLSVSVCEMWLLERVEVDCLDWAAITHLGSLQSLVFLQLAGFPETSPPPPDVPMFPSLQELHLGQRADVRSATCFLKFFRDTPLIRFEAGLSLRASTAAQVYDFLCALAAGCSPSLLTWFDLSLFTVRNEQGQNNEPFVIPSDATRPLFCFINLEVLIIRSEDVHIDWDDAALANTARAWPRIELVDLTSSLHVQCRLTLLGLRSLAQYCPCLTSLRITLDARTIPLADNLDRTSAVAHPLHSLTLVHCPITAPVLVSQYLSALFSNLRSVQPMPGYFETMDEEGNLGGTEDFEYYQPWGAVESLLLSSKGQQHT